MSDQITQSSVLALIDMIESAPVEAVQAGNLYPRTWIYAERHNFVMVMGNGIARATTTGGNLVRFAALPRGDAS